MEDNPETILEEREEYMVSPIENDKNPTFRTAHFLRPYITSIDDPTLKFPSLSLSSLPATFEPSKWPLKVTFDSWRFPLSNWIEWVDYLHSKYKSTWKKVGIYEAIMSSKFEFPRDNDLVFGVTEKWCSETNTFIFPWGEATITLEDIMILGGYPVLGDSVSAPLHTCQLISVEEELNKVRVQLARSISKKCTPHHWLNHFTRNDSEFEHEAFLALWLSRCVFPIVNDTITKRVIPIAVHLASGKRIALAPTILACIYRDLSSLKQNIINSVGKDENLLLNLWSPFQIIQIWALERFVKIRPTPSFLEPNEPRVARWHKLDSLRIDNIRLALDTAGFFFEWRPYAKNVDNWDFPKFYAEKEEWISVDSELHIEIESFARCLMPCELVGLDCIEPYLPHRVAMQFGIDQDIPGHVARLDERNIDKKLYLPSRHFEPCVTARYFKWWRRQDLMECDFVEQRTEMQYCFKSRNINNHIATAPGCPQKCVRVQPLDFSYRDDLNLIVPKIVRLERFQDGLKCVEQRTEMQYCFKRRKIKNDIAAPPGFAKKCVRVQPLDSSDSDDLNLIATETVSLEWLKDWLQKKDKSSVHDKRKSNYTNDVQLQRISSKTADNKGTNEKNMSNGSGSMCAPNIIKGEDEIETMNSVESEIYNKCKEEFEFAGLEMEFMVENLEKIVAKLKAEHGKQV